MRFLLDTNVLSELVKRAPDPRVVAWMESHSSLDILVSVLTLGELVKGVRLMSAGPRREALEHWVSVELPVQLAGRLLSVDAAVSVAWGSLAAAARRSGRELPVIDGLLLATASTNDLVFATRNLRDCEGRGVEVVDPWGG